MEIFQTNDSFSGYTHYDIIVIDQTRSFVGHFVPGNEYIAYLSHKTVTVVTGNQIRAASRQFYYPDF